MIIPSNQGRENVLKMILADKIIEERKKNGWSQEELAQQLGVSRQAVSKWESAGSVPDLQKIIQMADLFGVTTDYLLKDELLPETETPAVYYGNETAEPVRRVSMEEANEFLEIKAKGAPVVANATALCILSPVILIVLGALAESRKTGISEGVAGAVGCIFLFGMVALAVYMFITFGLRESRFESFEKEYFETEYGVTGMVREKSRAYEGTFARGLAMGVVLCIISVIPLIVAGAAGAPDFVCAVLVGLLLLMVAAGVNTIIRVSMIKSSYDTLLQEGEYTREEKQVKKKLDTLSGIYWCTVTAIYLGWSFLTMRWDFTWIVWPVAGVLFAAIYGVMRLIVCKDIDRSN